MKIRFLRSEIEKEYKDRVAAHKGQKSTRLLNEHSHFLGIVGEAQFEADFGIKRNKKILPGGDGRIDFQWGNHTYDVKLRDWQDVKSLYLLREIDVRHAEILVLGIFREEGKEVWGAWCGWEYDSIMVKRPTRQFRDDGPFNHYKLATDLRDISEMPAPRLAVQVAPPERIPTHAEHCAGCYEIEPDRWIHPPRNGGPLWGNTVETPKDYLKAKNA